MSKYADDEWQEMIDGRDKTIQRLNKRVEKLEELVIKSDKRLVFMSYPLCTHCGSLLRLTGNRNVGFVECTKEKCGACYDKSQLLALYIKKGNTIDYLVIEKWWREVIEIMKRQNEGLGKKEVENKNEL